MLEDNIRKVVPYTPGEQPDRAKMVKLNTNENPYPPAPAVEDVLRNFNTDKYRLYPDPKVSSLVKAIADYYKVNENQVFVGVGSDDVLAMSFMTFFNSDKPIYFPDITYSFYDVWADLLKIPYETKALDSNFFIKAEDYMANDKCGGVVFPNPNAPTGALMPISEVEKIVAANPDVVVIVDEAYIDFGGESALPLVDKYDNIVVVQTFSKSRSFAGGRVGFAISNSKLIKYLNDVKYSFNSYTMDRVTIEAGVAAISDDVYFKECCNKIIKTREWTSKELRRLGFSFNDSASNFIFATHEKVPAKEIFEALKKADIFVRYFDKPRINNYLRISIGTDDEMKQLINFLEEYI